MRSLEICHNTEWLVTFSHLSDLFTDGCDEDIACLLVTRITDEVENQVDDIEVISPKPGRSTCHGWNGAQFRWRYGPVGTFGILTEREQDDISRAVDAAAASIDEDIASWPA
jgi:hypothetical protein